MATYETTQVASSRPPATSTSAGQAVFTYGQFTVATALALNDVIRLCQLPPGHVPVDFILDTDDLDTNGTPTIVVKAGIEGLGSANQFLNASTVGQAGGVARADQIGFSRIAPTETKRNVIITVTTGPATGATSVTLRGTLVSRPALRDE